MKGWASLLPHPNQNSITYIHKHTPDTHKDVGTHAQLMERSEVYRQLVKRQIVGNDDDDDEGGKEKGEGEGEAGAGKGAGPVAATAAAAAAAEEEEEEEEQEASSSQIRALS
jgi:hypothetical protein